MNYNDKIYVAGHDGMVGSAICKNLNGKGFSNLITEKHSDYNLILQNDVNRLFKKYKPDYVIDAAAKVGGIQANNIHRGQFIYENMMIQNNLIHASHINNVKKFLFLGSSCIYPRMANQPIKEEYLLTGMLEETNEPYAIAKISGIKMCENYYRQYGSNFISVMPTNLYGAKDNFDLESSHVVPALLKKIINAKAIQSDSVEIWGTGTPRREFMHVDDMASACVFILENIDAEVLYNRYNISHINIGTGVEHSVTELAQIISRVVGYKGKFRYDLSKPDGTPKKLLDVSLLSNIGWTHSIKLEEGIKSTFDWYVSNH